MSVAVSWVLLAACGGELEAELASAQALVAEQTETIAVQRERIEELEARVAELEKGASAMQGLQDAMDRAYGAEIAARCVERGGRFVLSREGFDEIVANTQTAVWSAKWIPHRRDGAPIGWRVFGMNRGSLTDSCGLRNGDVITEVSGVTMTPEGGPEPAWAVVETDRRAVVTLERQGKPMELIIEVE